MTIYASTLRPGLLVSMKTKIEGNVDYNKVDIVADHITSDGQRIAEWRTERVIEDAQEHEKAVELRAKARSLLTSVCSRSDFGLLCPDNKIDQLEAAIREARRICAEFNDTARLTEIEFSVLTGRIVSDDLQAVRAINSEVRGLLDEMKVGVTNLDVKAIREAAQKAKQLGAMLSPAAQASIQEAIETVRAEAKKIVKAGDQAATEVDAQVLAKLASARTAFLDLDDATEIVAVEATARAVDLDPEIEALLGDAPAAPVLDLEDMLA